MSTHDYLPDELKVEDVRDPNVYLMVAKQGALVCLEGYDFRDGKLEGMQFLLNAVQAAHLLRLLEEAVRGPSQPGD